MFDVELASRPTRSHETNHTAAAEPTGADMKDRSGWDGKLRVDGSSRRAVLTNPEALEDSDYSDEDAPSVEEIGADEGKWLGNAQ
jgi:hypothetical protein